MENDDMEKDVVESVNDLIYWAFKLGYGDEKSVRIAYRACEKKGLCKAPEFEAAWTIALDLKGLGALADQYTDFGKGGVQ